jgi:hypothetical protein
MEIQVKNSKAIPSHFNLVNDLSCLYTAIQILKFKESLGFRILEEE